MGTMQIEDIKNTILMRQKEQMSASDDDDDVEMLLNNHEQTMKTMRLQQEIRKSQESINAKVNEIDVHNAENIEYHQVTSPNNIDMTYNQRIVRNSMEEKSEDDSSEEMPIGRLADRIDFIKRRCIEGMQLDGFRIAYNLMKKLQYESNADIVSMIDGKIEQLCNQNGQKVSKSRVIK